MQEIHIALFWIPVSFLKESVYHYRFIDFVSERHRSFISHIWELPTFKKILHTCLHTRFKKSSVSWKENLLGDFSEINSCVRVLGCGPKLAFQKWWGGDNGVLSQYLCWRSNDSQWIRCVHSIGNIAFLECGKQLISRMQHYVQCSMLVCGRRQYVNNNLSSCLNMNRLYVINTQAVSSGLTIVMQ